MLKRTAFLVSTFGCLCVLASAIGGQVRVPLPETQVMAAGQISRIYASARSFELRSTLPGSRGRSDTLGGLGGNIQTGPVVIGGGAGVPGGGIGAGPRDPITNPQPFPDRVGDESPRYSADMIFTTTTTRIHEDGRDLFFAALRVGDRVTVRGVSVGDDIQASDVARGELIPGLGIVED